MRFVYTGGWQLCVSVTPYLQPSSQTMVALKELFDDVELGILHTARFWPRAAG